MHRDRFESHQSRQTKGAAQQPGARSFDRRGDDERGRFSDKLQKAYGIREQEALWQIRELRARY